MDSKDKGASIRTFECGHQREDAVRFMLGQRHQEVGEMGYCRECMREVRITNVRKE